jgi:hypothetical protein
VKLYLEFVESDIFAISSKAILLQVRLLLSSEINQDNALLNPNPNFHLALTVA